MTAHTHTQLEPGCYRCELNRDEVRAAQLDEIREVVGDGPVAGIVLLPLTAEQAVRMVEALRAALPEDVADRCGTLWGRDLAELASILTVVGTPRVATVKVAGEVL